MGNALHAVDGKQQIKRLVQTKRYAGATGTIVWRMVQEEQKID